MCSFMCCGRYLWVVLVCCGGVCFVGFGWVYRILVVGC